MKRKSRKLSVERFSSPEQIDRLLKITSVPGWIALIFILLLIAAIVVWAFVGRIPVTVTGNGVFFDPSEVLVIQNDIEGVIEKILVKEDMHVQKGDSLFILTNRAKSLKYQEFIQLIDEAQIMISENDEDDELKWELIKLQQQKETLNAFLQGLEIRAPAKGKILSIEALEGKEIDPGTTLAWMEKTKLSSDQELVYAFFSLEKGGQIKPGMKALLQFTGVSTEEFGKMEGSVIEVLPFSSSTGYILQSVPSEELREFITKNYAWVQVRIEPTKDPETVSGYKWTTPQGPPFQISWGKVVKISVLIEQKKPIDYLIK